MPNFIIVGLGNPGSAYQFTRHNAGFMVVDALATKLGLTWQNKAKWRADIAQGSNLILVKPQTFMNQSGDCVASLVKFYNWQLSKLGSSLIVIHDDLDMALGQFKKTLGKGPKQHNGVISLENSLQTDQFIRYRIGIDQRKGDRQIAGEEYVLSDFRPEERQILDGSIAQVMQELIAIINQ